MKTLIDLEKPSLDSLTHFGILGMKWGVRRYQNKDGSLTRAGIFRYGQPDSPQVAKAKEKVEAAKAQRVKATKAYFSSPNTSSRAQKRLNASKREEQYAIEDLSNVKILEKLNSKEKSKTQLDLETKYKAKGMNDDEAAVAAYKNIRTKKILAVAGVITVSAIAAYGTYKWRDNNVDKLIKSGTSLQNISIEEGVRDSFYASGNKLDNAKYRGLYAGHLENWSFKKPYQNEIKVASDIKQASYKSAKNTLQEMVKNDPEFAEQLTERMSLERLSSPVYTVKSRAATESLKKGIVDKNVYDVFNGLLVDHEPGMQKLTDKFYSVMSSKGYNAIKDINDSKYSGYKSINPIIAFNTKGKVSVVNIKQLTDNEIKKAAYISMTHLLGSELVKIGGTATVGYLGVKSIKSSNDSKRINAYRKEHPASKMSNTEIIRMLERKAMEADK